MEVDRFRIVRPDMCLSVAVRRMVSVAQCMFGTARIMTDECGRSYHYQMKPNRKGSYFGDDLRSELMIAEIEDAIRERQHKQLMAQQRQWQPQVDYSWLIDRPKTSLNADDRRRVRTECSRLLDAEWNKVVDQFRVDLRHHNDATSVESVLGLFVRCVQREVEQRSASSIVDFFKVHVARPSPSPTEDVSAGAGCDARHFVYDNPLMDGREPDRQPAANPVAVSVTIQQPE